LVVSGNVGIGTNTPAALLSLLQKDDANGVQINGYDDNAAKYMKLNLDSGGYANIVASSGFRFMQTTENIAFISSAVDNGFRLYSDKPLTFGETLATRFGFERDATSGSLRLAYNGMATDYVTVSSNGTVTISSNLTVGGTITAGGNAVLTNITASQIVAAGGVTNVYNDPVLTSSNLLGFAGTTCTITRAMGNALNLTPTGTVYFAADATLTDTNVVAGFTLDLFYNGKTFGFVGESMTNTATLTSNAWNSIIFWKGRGSSVFVGK
jgi:hypothetical protein